MLRRDMKYFMLAKDVSKMSDHHKIKIGAVIVHNKEVISIGYNHKKTHPMQKRLNLLRFTDSFDKCHHYIHAEMMALVNAKYHDLTKAKIYVYRESKLGIQMCRPCAGCLSAIKDAGIKTIYYTTSDGFCKEELV